MDERTIPEQDLVYMRKCINLRFPKTLSIEVSRIALKACWILSETFNGIHHCDFLRNVTSDEWTNRFDFKCSMDKVLSTYDYMNLTRLVVLCHDNAVRIEIRAVAPRRLCVYFGERVRQSQKEIFFLHHPSMEQAICRVRKGGDLF